MKRPLLVAFLSLGFSLSPNSADSPEPVTVDAICGKLVSIEVASEKETTNSDRQEPKPLSHARVRLFSPTAAADCCDLMTPVAEVTTGRDGSFQFKKPSPGDYWLVATINGTEYKLLIRYQPGKKTDAKCAEFQYALEKGKLYLRNSTTVTAS